MRISIATRLILGFMPALFAVLVSGAVFYGRLTDVEEDNRWVAHTLEVLLHLDNTRAHLAEAKSSASAYQLAPRTEHQRDFQTAATQSEQAVERLRMLLADNPEQQKRLTSLRAALNERLAHLQAAIAQADMARGRPGQELADNLDPLGPHTAVPLILAMQGAERQLLDERRAQQLTTLNRSVQVVIALAVASAMLILMFGAATIRRITRPLLSLEASARRVGDGDYEHRLDTHSDDEIGRVASVFNKMVAQIQEREVAVRHQTWLKSSLASFTPIFQTGQDLAGVAQATLTQLARLLDAPRLALYIRDDNEGAPILRLCAGFAATDAPQQLAAGQGLTGQCLVDGQVLLLDEPPAGYFRIASSLGSAEPRQVYITPILFESQVRAVLEVALLRPLTEIQTEFMKRLVEGLGLMLNALEARQFTERALHVQTELSESLSRQQQALQHSNEELAIQTEQLRASERLARDQQDELRLANEEQQQANEELRKLTHTLDIRAQQLAETSAVKSEFLANMSHELRTPLNSLLILSKLLAEDSDHPLSPKQQQYARTIHESGNDLLQQINEILDMARIESGKVNVDAQPVALGELVRLAEQSFRPVAQTRSVAFEIDAEAGLPTTVRTDQGRVWQILKNLLANAFKFTNEGSVRLRIHAGQAAQASLGGISFTVQDTGIGIPHDKQAQIFEAFQQGDSGIARQYGGTGLGLSISLKLAHLLGGSLQMQSEPGQGSRFTLTLPLQGPPQELAAEPAPPPRTLLASLVNEAPPLAVKATAARAVSADGLASLVVMSDQPNLLTALTDLAAQHRLQFVQSSQLDKLVATCAAAAPVLVVLDTSVEGPMAWTALGHLKQDARTRHMAVHVLCHPGQKQRALRLGAASYTMLPLDSIEVLTETVAMPGAPDAASAQRARCGR